MLDHLVREALELLDAERLDAAAKNLAEARSIAPHDASVLGGRAIEDHIVVGVLQLY